VLDDDADDGESGAEYEEEGIVMEAWEEELEEHLGSPTTQSEKCSWSAL
jgi:hypothetical protein